MRNNVAALSLLVLFASSNAQAAGSDAHWSYEGDAGPEHWSELSADFSRCQGGQNQSPVDLVADFKVNLPELVFDYHGTPIRETNNGHTIMLNAAPGNFLSVPERQVKAELKQAHFHSPSEHTINGEHFSMEIHLVHSNEEGHLFVVGVMVEEGEENPMLNRIWSFMPEQVGGTSESPLTVFEAGVLPPTRNYFSYAGSLTTPPCSEGVSWIVLREPLTASAEQVERFKQRVGPATNRPVQEKNARAILN
ncbi:carbonic anhydrase [Pseudomonadota bacterium]